MAKEAIRRGREKCLGEGGGRVLESHKAGVENIEVMPEGAKYQRVVSEEAIAATHAQVGKTVGCHALDLQPSFLLLGPRH
jgi:hypothetical protein